jgi:hypothetical protein
VVGIKREGAGEVVGGAGDFIIYHVLLRFFTIYHTLLGYLLFTTY